MWNYMDNVEPPPSKKKPRNQRKKKGATTRNMTKHVAVASIKAGEPLGHG